MPAPRVRVKYRQATEDEIRRGEPMRRMLVREAEPIRRRAQQAAPRSSKGSHGRASGYLAQNIIVISGINNRGVYARVVTRAKTPKGFPYGVFQQKIRPYIRARA